MGGFFKRTFFTPEALLRLLTSWFVSCAVFEVMRPGYILYIWGFSLLWVSIFAVVTALHCLLPVPQLTRGLLAVGALIYAFVLVACRTNTNSTPLFVLIVFAVGLVLFPLLRTQERPLLPLAVPRRLCITVCIIIAVFFIAVLGTIGCLRYLTFSSPNYDFGIFCQMFHNMRKSFLPYTTCERNQLLSHFAVHISPIYYVILPFYALFPSPITLQIAQTLVLASGMIPVFLLARQYRLSHVTSTVMVLLYAAYPAVSTGCFYDIHENCFLVPLLLWLFLCYEKGRFGWLWIPAVLILTVKEDAAVYLAFFALYILLIRRDLKRGLPLFAVAAVWFVTAILLLKQFGTGAMFGRYKDLLNADRDTGGLLGTLLRDPAAFLEQIVAEKTLSKKLIWVIQLLLPFGLLLWTPRGKYGRLFLLCPLLINLLTHYTYQFNINFQYSFGTLPFLFYLFIQNVADNPPRFRRDHLIFATVTACLMYSMLVLPKFGHYVGSYINKYELYSTMETALDSIPDDASVTASTVLIPHISQRSVLYEDVYHKTPDTDYVALDLRGNFKKQSQKYLALCLENEYIVVQETEDVIVILKKPTA